MKLGLVFWSVLFVCYTDAIAFGASVDDCILNGLKGVNSDAAARMVRQSCENKAADQKRQQLVRKYGDRLDEKLAFIVWELDYSQDALKVTLKNDLTQTVTYVELSISKPRPNGECPYQDSQKYLYATKMRPGSSIVLIVPAGTSLVSNDRRNACISSRAVRGKESSVFDISIGPTSPLTASQLDELNRELDERYATIYPPLNSLPRGALFDFKTEDLFKKK